MKTFVIQALKDPDEIYRDRRGGFHCLKKIRIISDYIIVIYVYQERQRIYKDRLFYKYEKKTEEI